MRGAHRDARPLSCWRIIQADACRHNGERQLHHCHGQPPEKGMVPALGQEHLNRGQHRPVAESLRICTTAKGVASCCLWLASRPRCPIFYLEDSNSCSHPLQSAHTHTHTHTHRSCVYKPAWRNIPVGLEREPELESCYVLHPDVDTESSASDTQPQQTTDEILGCPVHQRVCWVRVRLLCFVYCKHTFRAFGRQRHWDAPCH